MKRIQDVRDFENEITAKVEEYLQEKDCYECPVMTIGHEDGELVIDIDDMNKVHRPDDFEEYAMGAVVRACDDNPEQLEPDFDGISYIANQWVFIEH